MSVVIRPAAEADAAAIAGIHVRGWRAAYRGLVPETLLGGLSVERRERGWRELIAARGRRRLRSSARWMARSPASAR